MHEPTPGYLWGWSLAWFFAVSIAVAYLNIQSLRQNDQVSLPTE